MSEELQAGLPEEAADDERDPRISRIFYYFAEHTNTATGRTVGRKIGVVQEIICRKFILQSERLTDAIVFEPFLPGISGASHKVEFVFFQPSQVIELEIGDSYRLDDLQITLVGITPVYAAFSLVRDHAKKRIRLPLHTLIAHRHAPEFIESKSIGIKVSGLTKRTVRISILDLSDVRASVESKRVGAQRFSGSDKLGSGIQSIEKAKQAALVAVDADLQFNKTTKALPEQQTGRRKYISVVVLGNGVHWTEKDKSILRTYVDYTYLVPDHSIIRYAEFVREIANEAGADFFPFFMSYFEGMTKTAPDAFTVDANDFEIICPEEETRSLLEVLEAQIDDYPVAV